MTFSGESASGWQTATFATPVAVTAGITYVASYYAPLGHYSATSGGLNSAVDNPPLHALGNSTSANGVYAYGAASAFPTNTWGATNYWVDVMYAMPKPGQVTGATATAGGSTSAKVAWTAPSDGGPVSSLPDHPVRRLHPVDAGHRQRLAAGDEQDRRRPDDRHHVPLHRRGRQRQRRRDRRPRSRTR